MMHQKLSINSIEKESIPYLSFEENEVLDDPFLQIQRSVKLHSAMLLGNCFKEKVSILFKTLEGIKEVKTTVWAATEKYVVLKSGISIPVVSILSVNLF